jgi:hypothetical protein
MFCYTAINSPALLAANPSRPVVHAQPEPVTPGPETVEPSDHPSTITEAVRLRVHPFFVAVAADLIHRHTVVPGP